MLCPTRHSFALAAAFLLLAGCSKHKGWQAQEVDHSYVAPGRAVLKTGSVGAGRFEVDATYVLVDAKNSASDDLMVTLEGDLLSESGDVVGSLRPQSLRVPGNGGVRMFALMDKGNRAVPGASRARIRVRGAMVLAYPASVIVTDGVVNLDEGRAVVRGFVENTARRNVAAIVIASFYDEAGQPMSRPSTKFDLDGQGKRGVQFVGPTGSRSASLYVGQTVY